MRKGEAKVPRKQIDLLIENASELVTAEGANQKPLAGKQMQSLKIIRNAALAIRNGKITAVDKTPKVKSRFKAFQTLDASGKTLIPGFVDPHTHLVFAGSREEEFKMRLQGVSYMDIHQRGGGILKTVRETRRTSESELVRNCEKKLNVMLEHGTTTLEAKSGYGLTVEDEVKLLRVMQHLEKTHPIDIVSTFLGAHAIPPEYEKQPIKYVKLIREKMIPAIAHSGLAEFCDVFCEKGVFSIEQTKQILSAGKKHGLKPKLHADELTPFGAAELAAEVGAVSAEHLLYTSSKGLKMMVECGVIAVLLPAAAFALMTEKYADARKMIKMNLPVALGTDFNPSCWVENQQLVIALACRQMKMTPAEALTAATINAAHAICRADEVGSLEPGKKADILILDVPNHSFLGYSFGTNPVEKVIKEGKLAVSRR